MIACINIASLLEYGKPQGILKRSGVAESLVPTLATPAIKAKLVKKVVEEKIGVDSVNGEEPQKSPILKVPEVPEQLNAAFQLALKLTFEMFSQVFDQSEQTIRATMNPYLTVMLTFLATILQHPVGLSSLEHCIHGSSLPSSFYVC